MEKVTRDVCMLTYPPKVYGRTLEEVERTAQEVIERIFRDKDGILRSGVNGRDMQPLEEKDVPDRPHGFGTHAEYAAAPRRLKAVWLNYENTGQASGKYLRAMLNKYAVTKDPKVLGHARKTLEALALLWNNCARDHQWGRGWMPKPYGGIREVAEVFECSVDQYCDITQGIDAFSREAATPSERQMIKEMILSFADWWIDHDYTAGYFGICNYWKKAGAHPAGYFLYLNALAYSIVPRRKYLEGFNLWLELSQHLSAPTRRVCLNGNGLALECLQRLMELRPDHREFWLLCARTCADNMVALFREGQAFVGNPTRFQMNAYCAHHLCTAHALLPERGYDKMIAELLTTYNKRGDFYHLSRGQRLDKISPMVAGGDYRNTFWAEGHIAWLNAYWTLKRLGR